MRLGENIKRKRIVKRSFCFILVFINLLQGPSYALAAGIEDEVYQESMNTNLRKRN